MLHAHRRGIAAFTVWALLVQTMALVFTVLPPVLTPANAAGPEITVTKDSPVQILAGENVRYSITVTNSGDMVEYNASISDVLPFGATYAGNPSPASAGPPRQSVDAVSGRAILIWENLADLGPGNTYTLEFDVDPGVEGDTVGNSFENNAYAAASTQQRDVPDFDESGVPIPAAEVQIDDTSLVTEVTALEVRKTNDNSPEGELLRGVHDNRSTYTLEVEANKVAATDDVILVDFLPASLEFLGCGDGDNTTGGAEEYPGAGPLGSPALVPSPCPTPASVSTIAVPPAFPGLDLPAGTYTRVEWNLGTLAPGSITQVKFVAGIPVQRNTTDWPNGEPDPASLAQGSNLDNNTGPSTRELSGESSVINFSTASGIYQGPTIDGDPAVRANGSNRVTVEDLRMRKSASPDNAVIGEIVTFSITVDTSEYVSGQDIVITDTLPDGLCPLAPGQNFDPGQAPECAGRVPPTVPYDTVTYDPGTGGYDIVFEPVAIAPQDTLTVEFQALLRFNYNSPGPRGGLATVAGDSFTNTVALTGTTVPIDGIVDTGEVTVGDESSVTIGSDKPSISKQMKPRVVPMDCSENVPPGYDDPENLDRLQKAFRQGDLICFKLRVDFPATIATEDYVVSDFLPVGTEFLPGSFQPTANNTAAVNAIVTEPRYAEAVLGTEVPGSGRFVVPAGAVFEAVFGVIVLAPAPGPLPDLVGNLLKTVHQNTDGSVFVDRDSVDFEILPSANVSLQKGVYAVDAPPAGPNGPDTDGSLVQEQSQVTYRLDISNAGLPEFPDGDFGVLGVQAWDVLPLGLACDSISNYQFDAKAPTPNTSPVLAPLPTDLVTCTDPGDANHPTVDPAYGDSATQSIIVWQMPTPDLADTYRVDVGETLTLTYDLRMPDEVSVSSRFDNTAGVAEFRALTNRSDDTAPYYPANNIDGDITPEQENAPAANDPSYVITNDAGITKTQTTSITETNNNTATQATIGEEVDYTVEVTIPARTAVYDAVLSDPLPRDGSDQALTLVSATATGPAGPVLSTTTNPDVVTLTFPPVYQNDTDQPQVFGFQVTARVADISRNTHNRTRTNTATFTSNLAPGGAAVTPRTAASTMTVVEPSPSIVKSVFPTSGFGGQEVVYTIESSNANGRPPAHDTVVTDCLPPQLNWGRVLSNTAGPVTVDNGDGTNGCPPGVNNRAQWQVGTVLPGTANIERLTFTGQIIPTAIGGTVLTNTVDQTSSTLADGTSTPGNTERVYDRNTSADVTVVGTINSKGVTPEQATIGETVTYTVSQRVPELTVFFQFSLIDQLPAGLDPAVKTLDVSCTPVGPGCDQIEGNAGYGTPLTSSGQTIGWYFGDVAAVSGERIVSVTYSTTVQNLPVDVVGPPNQAGATPTNSARPWWTVDPRVSPPTSVLDPPAAPGARAGTPVSAVLNLREPKLAIEKQVSNTTPQPGDPLDFTVEVSNPAGTTISEAFDISLSDDVPAGIVVDPTSISDNGVLTGADPVTGGGTITWAAPNMLGPLAPGESVTLTYSAALAPSENLTGAPLQNTATIDSYSSLPDGFPERRQYSGPSSSAEVTPRFPEVTTVKTATNGEEAFIDKPFSWTLAVTNTGTGDALAVDATDTLPTNFCYLAGSATIALPGAPTVPVEPDAIPSDCTSTPFQQALTWTDFGDLAPGETARITLQSVPTQAVVNTPGVGLSIPHTNSAVATGQDPTGATGNADGSYSGGPDLAIARIAAADLQLVKSAVTPLVAAGQTATFTMDVVNQGPDPSLAPFVLADRIPLGTTVVTATGPGWVCINAEQLVNCVADAPTSLAPGASLPTLTLVITIPKDAPDGEVYENSATVRGPSLDTNLVNNTDTALVTAIRVADLQITKATASQPIVPGEQVTYDLVVANNGPSDAQQPITVTDTLPVGLSYVSAVGTGWNCSAAGQDITCVRGQELTASAPDNVAPTIAVTADLDPAFAGDLTNTAVVTGVSPDPVQENNTSTVVDPAAPQADLFVEKSTVSDPLVAGAEATYTLGVGNLGPSVSVAPITVTDALPAGLTYVSATGSGWTCSNAGQDVTCVYATDLPVNVNTPDITVTATVAPDFVGDLTNPAEVTGTTPDPVTENNATSVTDPVTAQADLAIVKTTVTDPVVPGEEVAYDLAVTNNGPSVSRNPITVTDSLDPALTYSSATGSGWTCTDAGQDVTCVYGADLAVGETAPPITLVADLDPAFTGDLANTAGVSGTTPDPITENNTSTVVDPTTPEADLAIVKTTVTDPVVPGEDVAYDLAVTNSGPSVSVAPITVTDSLDPALTYTSATGTGWTCTDAGQDVTCVYGADLAVGETAPPITLTADLDSAVTGDLANTAGVSGTTPDPVTENNTSTVVDPTTPAADLAIVKTTVTDPVVPGEEVAYDLAVTNNGPSVSLAPITVTDTLPAGLTYVSAAGSGWTCTDAGQDVTCGYDTDLPPNVSAPTITIVADVDAALTGELANTAAVTGTTPDPITENNTSTVVDPLQPLTDLAIVKTTVTAELGPGEDVAYELVVTNTGPSDAAGPIEVTDTLPDTLTFVSADGDGWLCDAVGQEVTCTRGTVLPALDPDNVAPAITVVATVDGAFTGDVDNTATVTGPDPDPDPENNTSTVVDPVPALVDMDIDKTAVGEFVVGSPGTFVVTVGNNGPTLAPGPVTVVDTLPTGLQYVSATGAGWDCAAAGQVVTCLWAEEFGVGQTSQITVTVEVLPAAVPEVTNSADVTTDATETTLENNSAQATVSVRVPPTTTPSTGAGVYQALLAALMAVALGVLAVAAADRRRRLR